MDNQAHGIMFHHFHGGEHIKAQGSLSANDFADLIDWYGKDHNIICARDFYERAAAGRLTSRDVVLTFDDALRCQYDIAAPVLADRDLTAFWFVYTSPLEGVYEKLEIYHHFRFYMYPDIEDFYAAFFDEADRIAATLGVNVAAGLSDGAWRGYKPESTFYTDGDRRFRYARDYILGAERYNRVMDAMMESSGYVPEEHVDMLWIDREEIVSLRDAGHIIGLHSHTHPTTLGAFLYVEQKKEYETCRDILEGFLGEPVTSVSYPCDSFNDDTAQIMRELGVNIGFRAYPIAGDDPLFIPREDHSILFDRMRDARSR